MTRCPETPTRKLLTARELRRLPTPAEVAVWEMVRGHRLGGYKFYRQF
ncbi:MAG: DUF559 domain-containing protein, partial [bacterium]